MQFLEGVGGCRGAGCGDAGWAGETDAGPKQCGQQKCVVDAGQIWSRQWVLGFGLVLEKDGVGMVLVPFQMLDAIDLKVAFLVWWPDGMKRMRCAI